MAYSAELDKHLDTTTYNSHILAVPNKVESLLGELDLNLINDEKNVSEWLGERMKLIKRVLTNEEKELYRKEENILNEFKEEYN